MWEVNKMRKKLDAVNIQILWSRLIGITDEASSALVRTAFSSIVRDAHDYACAIFNSKGKMIALNTRGTPGLFGGMTNVVGIVIKEYKKIVLGDIYLTNDPWMATGHLNDITIVAPIFYHKKMVSCIGIGSSERGFYGSIK